MYDLHYFSHMRYLSNKNKPCSVYANCAFNGEFTMIKLGKNYFDIYRNPMNVVKFLKIFNSSQLIFAIFISKVLEFKLSAP